MGKKGQVWVSVVLYSLIAIIIVVLVLEAGLPILGKAKDQALFAQKKDDFVVLDQYIKEISREEEGSQRLIPLNVEKGELLVEKNSLKWEMETEASIIEPGSRISIGDVKLMSNADVDAYEDQNYIYLENSNIIAKINKIGTAENQVQYSTTNILNEILLKARNSTIELGNSTEISVAEVSEGTGYVALLDPGFSLDSAKVACHMQGEELNFTITLELLSDSDFIVASAEIN